MTYGNTMTIKRILLSSWTRWLVSLILLGLLLAISDLALIGQTIATANGNWLLAGFLMAMILTAYGGLKWWFLMPRNRASSWVFIRVNFVSNFVGIFFPGIIGIEAARIAGITRSSRDWPAAFSSVLVDRVFGLTALALTVVLGGMIATTVVPQEVTVACSLALTALLTGGGAGDESSGSENAQSFSAGANKSPSVEILQLPGPVQGPQGNADTVVATVADIPVSSYRDGVFSGEKPRSQR